MHTKYICIQSFSTMLDKSLRKNIKTKKGRDGETGKYKLNKMEALNMK